MLALKMTTILVLAALILAAPAVAQESPADAGEANAGSQQYRVHSSEALADGIRDASDTAGRGADAVNDALDDAPEDAGPRDGATGSSDGKVYGLTVLPETGGPPLLAAGFLLVGAGLLLRRPLPRPAPIATPQPKSSSQARTSRAQSNPSESHQGRWEPTIIL